MKNLIKYYFFANRSQLKIKYDFNNVHVCQYNVYFKIHYILVKNITDKVILEIIFILSLYPFILKCDGSNTDPFDQKLNLKFASKFDIGSNDCLKSLIFAKINNLNSLQQKIKDKILLNNYMINCCK